ncbi:hypothetical protein EYF80_039142 [Liparis tanakae]|uniref:Uncharacterized protein n=1 Tax=Liparis tanakae TaxID=230148 RepID=A0A4Z2GB85_9TELE|nr:hypothetical protein EYF80_039142 [Liparis tanakae]
MRRSWGRCFGDDDIARSLAAGRRSRDGESVCTKAKGTLRAPVARGPVGSRRRRVGGRAGAGGFWLQAENNFKPLEIRGNQKKKRKALPRLVGRSRRQVSGRRTRRQRQKSVGVSAGGRARVQK